MHARAAAMRSGAVRAALALAAVFLLGGCHGKVERCNAFVDEANGGQTAYVGLAAALANPDGLTKRADTLEASAKKLRELDLGSDATLVDLRDRYAGLTEQYAAGLRNLAQAQGNGDASGVLPLEQELDGISDKQEKLIQEINGYCGGR
jgi:hypothetical protein